MPLYTSPMSVNVSGGEDDHHEHELDEAIEPERRPDTVADPPADDGADRHATEEPVRIAETAWVVLPKTSTSWRAQTIS